MLSAGGLAIGREEGVMDIAGDKLIDMYRTMLRIRRFEEKCSKEFAAGRIPGTVHLYIGEEAVATGACACLRSDDYITGTHRGHGHVIAKGARTDRMMAEIYGRKTGYCKGKGGSMHIADPDLGILGANGIVGGGICVASGAGIGCEMRGKGQVVICFLGDGSTNEGAFHEGVNLAAIWDLPVVFVIENNLYAEKTRITDTAKIVDLADRALSYGIPGIVVDGNDIMKVYEAVGEAVVRAREGRGPTLIEGKTYRWHGHFEGDQQAYKTKEEADDWKKKDPIPRFRDHLVGKGLLSEAGAVAIDHEITREIEDAVKFALDSPFPAPEEAEEDVFA
jgi:TPP-dependent pyruvate/acetoin dehydrogenase alpha subunit